jgi:hypothetical protein
MSDLELWRWFPFLFVVAWVGLSLLASRIGGWQALARQYRATQRITGRRYWMKSAGMRWGFAYRSAINFGADSSGLFLSIFPLFRAGHPPLFIPWSDIAVSKEKRWLLDGTQLRFQKVPGVSLLIPTKLATSMLANGPR